VQGISCKAWLGGKPCSAEENRNFYSMVERSWKERENERGVGEVRKNGRKKTCGELE